jgi:hypothetical protein
MAIAHLQTQSATGNSGTASVAAFDATAGNTLIVVLTTSSTNAPTQSAGQTLTVRRSYQASGIANYVYELTNVQEAAQTFSFTFTAQE